MTTAETFWLFTVALATILNVANCQKQAQCCEEYCYVMDSDRDQSLHFGTKTPYQFIKGPANSRQYTVPKCTPAKIWLLSRHGTKLPNAKHLDRLRALESLRDEIVKNYMRGSKPDVGGLCEGDLDLLKQWKWDQNITADKGEFLTTQGWNDLKYLAVQYQRAYPDIIERFYDEKKFQFRYTKTQRTEASFKGFVEGLFGENAYEYVKVSHPPSVDVLLRPYEHCDIWSKADAKSPNSERTKFDKSRFFSQIVSDISTRLGFKYLLKKDQITDAYDMCRYDQSWKLEVPSPWCTAFTPNQINVLEYREDLKYYYDASFGRTMNSNMMCAVVADMLTHLESRDLPKVVAYFSHATAMQLFLTSLGVARDADSLRADNYLSMTHRLWRSSYISPFASNLAAVKYECPEENDQDKVMFFLNEKPLDLTWCKNGLCNWAEVQEAYKRFSRGDCAATYCTNSTSTLPTALLCTGISLAVLIAFKHWY